MAFLIFLGCRTENAGKRDCSDFTVQLLSDIKCVLNLPVKLKEHKVT